MTAEFIIIYYILYWIQYAVLNCDRHRTDGQFFSLTWEWCWSTA